MSVPRRKRQLLALLCLQEIDEEQAIIQHHLSKKSKQTHAIFKARESEGFFTVAAPGVGQGGPRPILKSSRPPAGPPCMISKLFCLE